MGTLVSFAIILVLCGYSTSCLIKDDKKSGPWEGKKFRRRLADCDCSPSVPPPGREYINDQIRRWTVYIKLEGGYNENSSVCIGTIVNSNLIATSHKCLTWETKQINFFDAWSPRFSPSSSVQLKHLRVSREIDFSDVVPIETIIYHPRYLESVQSGRFPQNDIVLLKMSNTGIGSIPEKIVDPSIPEIKPICVPTLREAENLLYIEPYYYGLDLHGEYKNIQRKLLLPGSECDKQLNKGLTSSLDSVCLKFDIEAPEVEGGVLLTTGSTNKHRFLTGIASWVGSKHVFDDWKFAYFSHVRYFVEYLEYQSHNLGSKWCRQPVANFSEPKFPSPEELETDLWHSQIIFHNETLDCACGHTNIGVGAPRIMGGTAAEPREFGWMVKLIIIIPGEGEAICGGSLINDRMILTAAHCVYDHEGLSHVDNIRAFIRSHLHENDPDEEEVKISKVILHPSYVEVYHNFKQFEYDIALFVLSTPLIFPSLATQDRNAVVPICLPRYDDPDNLVGREATDNPYVNFPVGHYPELHKLTKPIESLDDCKEAMVFKYVSDNFICGSTGVVTDSAEGDSGGPLMIHDKIGDRDANIPSNHHWIQVGLVSFGDPRYNDEATAVLNSVGVYTKVQKFLSFINFNANKYGAKWCKFETQ